MEASNSVKTTQAEPVPVENVTPPPVQTVQEPEEVKVEAEVAGRQPHIEMAQDDEGGWNWCLWSANGRPIAAGIQAWKRRNDCMKNVETALELFRMKSLKIVAAIK